MYLCPAFTWTFMVLFWLHLFHNLTVYSTDLAHYCTNMWVISIHIHTGAYLWSFQGLRKPQKFWLAIEQLAISYTDHLWFINLWSNNHVFVCTSTCRIYGYREAFGNLYYCRKREYGLQILTTLIEQSVEAQTTIIKHSNPHLEIPFEKFWIHPWYIFCSLLHFHSMTQIYVWILLE